MFEVNFEYEEKKLGKVRGFARRFYQLSFYDRGNGRTPGRVVTIVPSRGDYVCGACYKVNPKKHKKQVNSLFKEKTKEGYQRINIIFTPNKDYRRESTIKSQTKQVGNVDFEEPENSQSRKSKTTQSKQIISSDILAAENSEIKKSRIPSVPSPLRVSGVKRFDRPEKADYHPLRFSEQGSQQVSPQTSSLILGTNKEGGIEAVTFMGTRGAYEFSIEPDIETICNQILKARGVKGTNLQYFYDLCLAHHTLFPNEDDEYLEEIEHLLDQLAPKKVQEET